MRFSMIDDSLDSEQQRAARVHAQELERDATTYPDERAEILLDAAHQYAFAAEHERALDIYDDLIATGSAEDAQWARASKLDVLEALGRGQDVENEIARLNRSEVRPGPAGMVAEFLEHHGRLEQALEWFNLACRDVLAEADPELSAATLITRMELLGRARVREALGLTPDILDERVGDAHADFVGRMDRFAGRDVHGGVAERGPVLPGSRQCR